MKGTSSFILFDIETCGYVLMSLIQFYRIFHQMILTWWRIPAPLYQITKPLLHYCVSVSFYCCGFCIINFAIFCEPCQLTFSPFNFMSLLTKFSFSDSSSPHDFIWESRELLASFVFGFVLLPVVILLMYILCKHYPLFSKNYTHFKLYLSGIPWPVLLLGQSLCNMESNLQIQELESWHQ